MSVIVLCYRAEDEAGRVVEPVYEELEELGADYELILVANHWHGASDRTPEVAERLAEGRETVRTLVRSKEGGMGWDMRAGLAEARGAYLVVIDGDGEVPPHFAVEAYRLLKETGADIVKGRRRSRDDGAVRAITSLTYNIVFRLLFGTRGIWDVNGRPKALTRVAYERLALATNDWFTDAEIVLKARERGLEIVELPVVFVRNAAWRSFVGPGTAWEFVRNMLLWRLGRHPAIRRADGSTVSEAKPARASR